MRHLQVPVPIQVSPGYVHIFQYNFAYITNVAVAANQYKKRYESWSTLRIQVLIQVYPIDLHKLQYYFGYNIASSRVMIFVL